LDDVEGAQEYKDQLEKVYDLEAQMYRAQEYGADEQTLIQFRNRL